MFAAGSSSRRSLSRRDFLRLGGVAAAGTTLFATGLKSLLGQIAKNAAPEKLPNFIIIFTDDQGYGDLGCFGSPNIRTPHLDQMAREGVKFTSFYSASPICTPSRAALLTGCYPKRIGLNKGVIWPNSVLGLNPNETTIAEVLKTRGYATACVGKWHLGDKPQFLPTAQGFDHYIGVPYSNDQNGGDRPGSKCPLMIDTEVVEVPVQQDKLTRRYTEESIKFITENKSKPFFLYLAHTMPHVPLHSGKDFEGTSPRGQYGDTVEEIDWSVGQILKTLKDQGLDDNTFVVFTSDNGPWLTCKTKGGSAGPLREGKFSTYEGGMRVPCIMRWPGKLQPATTCCQLATTMDLLPTFAALAGAKTPEHKIDGRDINQLLNAPQTAKTPHEAFFYYEGAGDAELAAVRDGKWKLHINKCNEKTGQPEIQLFDLNEDVNEAYNLADKNPDVVKRLQKLCNDHQAEIAADSRPAGNTFKDAKPIGEWNSDQLKPEEQPFDFDATNLVTGGGKYEVFFLHRKGKNPTQLLWAALLVDGKEVSRDTHLGYAGDGLVNVQYNLELKEHKPGTKYIVRAGLKAPRADMMDSNGKVLFRKAD